MPCDTRLKPRQTLKQRAEEVRKAMGLIDAAVGQGRVKPVVGKQGAIAFTGISEAERDGITDACIYRRITQSQSGSAAARHAILKAELLAGRSVDKQIVGQGVHSHDSGKTWHGKG